MSKVVSVTSKGATFIIHGKKRTVDFAKCAENFKIVGHGKSGKTVGTRNIDHHTYTFYTSLDHKEWTVVRITGLFNTHFLRDWKFNRLERTIKKKSGYGTHDVS